MRQLTLPLLLVSLGAPLAAQSRSFQIDFGPPVSASPAATWNNVSETTLGSVPLHDASGNASTLALVVQGTNAFGGSFGNGVVVPASGSDLELAALGSDATRDGLFANTANGVVTIELSGLNSGATYELVALASELGALYERTTRLGVFGAVDSTLILEATDNVSSLGAARGLRADAQGRIVLTCRAARTAEGDERRVSLNALVLEEHTAGAPSVQFEANLVDVRRRTGAGAFSASLGTFASDLSPASLAVTAVDDSTGLAPTWLSLPSSLTAGQSMSLTFDEAALGIGSASATLQVDAPGFASSTTRVRFTVRPAAGLLNVLFYGNSYTQWNETVGALVRRIAIDAGLDEPWIVQRLRGGSNLAFHATNPGQTAAIDDALPLGETWDFVVVQGQSFEATSTLGNRAAFRANALQILTNVRAHSPAARACLMQTWARGHGHAFYPATFPGPADMHAELAAGYALAASDLRAAFGSTAATLARPGISVALFDWGPALFAPDLSHPSRALTLANSMNMFSTLFERAACSVAPDFTANSALAQRLNAWGFGATDWRMIAGYADRGRLPELRPSPGSDDDLILRSGVTTAATLCGEHDVALGQLVQLAVESPAGTHDAAPAFLYVDVHPTVLPAGPNVLYPEIGLGPGAVPLLSQNPLGTSGLGAAFPMPISFTGWSVALQGVAFGPSPITGNSFATTDVHELRMQ